MGHMIKYSGGYYSDIDYNLSSFSSIGVKKIGEYGFSDCKNVKYLYFPSCEYVDTFGIAFCDKLEYVDLSSCKYINSNNFIDRKNVYIRINKNTEFEKKSYINIEYVD